MVIPRKKLLIDIDGILANFHAEVCRTATSLGFPITYDSMRRWSVSEALSEAPPDIVDACLKDMASEGFNTRLTPNPEAQAYIPRIKQAIDILFVTSPVLSCKSWMVERIAWMRTHFMVEPSEILFANVKDDIRGDIFVDDNPSNVAKWSAVHPSKPALVWDMPYNREEYVNCARVNGWEDLMEIING